MKGLSHFIYDEAMGRCMDRMNVSLLIAVAGLVVMVCGFAAYVFVEPSTAWIALFAAGLVVLIAAYLFMQREGRRTTAELEAVLESEAAEGYVYYLDGEPGEDGARIEYLTRK